MGRRIVAISSRQSAVGGTAFSEWLLAMVKSEITYGEFFIQFITHSVGEIFNLADLHCIDNGKI
ncbi:MAG: hypothetical protein OXU36_02520 [Candidatus Poribacteria bacterium]|nr:hypothetical protein [Candidatus Poribacteria bacterium]